MLPVKPGSHEWWCQKSSDSGDGDSDKGAEMAENAVFVHHFAKCPPAGTQNFLRQGSGCFREGGFRHI